MKDRILAIISIIARFVMEDRDILAEGDLTAELQAVGFEAEEIDAAFNWMERLSLAAPTESEAVLSSPTLRVFTPEESRAFSVEARGLLVRLRSMGILDDEMQEEIIERALHNADDEVTLQELKTITVLTLFNRSHYDWRREVGCIIEDDWSRLYH